MDGFVVSALDRPLKMRRKNIISVELLGRIMYFKSVKFMTFYRFTREYLYGQDKNKTKSDKARGSLE